MRWFSPWRLLPIGQAMLIVLLAVLAGLLADRFAVSFDWTAGNRNTLTPASQRVIAALDDGPIRLVAYVYPGTERQSLREQLARYTRASSNISLAFRDPARYPQQVRRLNISQDGAVIASYQGRQTEITTYDEPHVTHALQRLSDNGSAWVVFVAGHGERDINDSRMAGYKQLASALDAQGLRTRTLNLADAQAVPNNTGLLVIASPQKRYLPGEVDMIQRYLARGGHLLWLDDPGKRYGLTPLANTLGIHWQPGTLVYPDFRKLGTRSPTIAVLANYPNTAVTRDLRDITLFPFAGVVTPSGHGPWQSQVFLRSVTRSWLETGSLDESAISYQPDTGDQRGPLPFGLLLSRQMAQDNGQARPDPADTQRAAVVADSDFLDNGHLDTLGNRTLGLSIFQWLVGRDDQIGIEIPAAPDSRLEMAPNRLDLLRWIFVIALPVALALIGTLRWFWRRRRPRL